MDRRLAAALVLWLLPGCSSREREHRIAPPRRVHDRLQLETPPDVRHGFAVHGDAANATAPAAIDFAYDLPDGWIAAPGGAMRLLSFRAAGGVDISVTVLAAGGGGLGANLERWREQLGLPPLAPSELAALPRRRVLGRDDAVVVDFAGTYQGGQTPIPGARMLGLVVPRDRGTLFVKLVGAGAAVATQAAAFDAFVASLRPAQPGAAPGGAAAPPDSGRLAWRVPEGWTSEPGAAMRAVTLRPGGDLELDAYVVILAGDAGGIAANLDRWRQQLSLPPLTEAERAALPRIDLLGSAAPVFFAANDRVAVLGTVAPLGTDSVFVKMVGPAAKVPAHREAFLAFCKSLEVR